MKKLIYLAAMVMGAILPVQAQNVLTAKDTISDHNIIFPPSFSVETQNLHENWYLQRYTLLDSAAAHCTGTPASDEVYKTRLQKLPNVIEMPYNSIVKAYIEMYALRKPQLVEQILGMSLYYMPIFEDACEKEQVPVELKYLPVIESALNPNAVSKAGACGLWQFMSGTATGEGLEVSSLVDERRDPISSSQAAVRYLKKLHDMYDDWTLAIAAYNCGPGNVNKAIQRAGDVKDYWAIYQYLPAETRGYVPAFIAANYIMNYYPEHGISHALARKPIVTDTVHVHNRVHFKQISDVLGIPMEELRILNPQYRQDVIPGHIRPYPLILPSVQAYCYVANEKTIVAEDEKLFGRAEVSPYDPQSLANSNGEYVDELVVMKHKVKKGETLKTIANKYGVTAESIRETNHLTSSRVKTGRVLTINTYKRKALNADSLMAAAPDSLGSPMQNDVAEVKPQTAEAAPVATTNKAAQTKKSTAKKTDTKKANTKKTANTKNKAGGTTNYTVRSGDNLSKIAKRHGTTIDAIKKASGLSSDKLQVGQKLKIPQK